MRSLTMTVLAICFLTLTSCSSQAQNASATSPALAITYGFSTEATYYELEINHAHLRYTYFGDTAEKCAQSVAQTPCWTNADLTTKEADLSDEETHGLIDLIRQTHFMQLKDSYGSAATGQRYYPSTLIVKLAGEEKRVVYQSFPEGEPMPEGFQRLSSRLEELVQQKF